MTNYELSFLLKNDADVLIIGSGGGNEVFHAHQWGASRIVGVELHERILDVSTNEHVAFGGHIYEPQNATAVVGDGRSYLQRSDELFDIIQMSGVDTWSGLSTGAYVLAENYLYTVDAFESYLEHLEADGVLAVTRFRLKPPRESLRLVSLAYSALERIGIDNPSEHIVVLTTNPELATVIVKRSPLDSRDLTILHNVVEATGGEIFYSPRLVSSNPYSDLISSSENRTQKLFVSGYHYDVSSVTDDRPFLFKYYKWSNIVSSVVTPGSGGQIGANRPVALLVLESLFVCVVVLSAVLIILPLGLFNREELFVGNWYNIIGYFAVIGLAFMFI